MKVVFLATGEIAIPAFRELLASDYEVLALVTQPDKAVGRRSALQPPAIKVIAEEAGLPVLQPEKVKAPESLQALRELAPEVMVVMAYGQILPQALIEIPSRAIINLHASLLPKYRGASCIQAALVNGDQETGWTVMHVVKALDAGDIISVSKLSITKDETGGSLHDRLAGSAPAALTGALQALAGGTASRRPQKDEESSYAGKLERKDGELDWEESALQLERKIRAYHPWPGTFTTFEDSKGRVKRLKVFPQTRICTQTGSPGTVLPFDGEDGEDGAAALRVSCGEGSIIITEVQAEGSRRMDAAEFLRGVSISRVGAC